MNTKRWNWIFDWSGTLVDDMALVISATNHVMRVYDKPEWQRESFRISFRLPYEEFYAEHIPGVPLEEIETHFREGFAIATDAVPMLPHAEDFLNYLQQQGSRMFVLTSMCPIAFGEQVDELSFQEFFEKTYAGVLDKRDVISSILTDNQLDPERTIFVGDMTHDIETAHHGGIHSAGVLTGYNHRAVLESVRPSLLFEDLAEFLALLSSGEDLSTLIPPKNTL